MKAVLVGCDSLTSHLNYYHFDHEKDFDINPVRHLHFHAWHLPIKSNDTGAAH